MELKQNYRSTSNIIKAADAVIANNLMRFPKKMETINDPGDLVTEWCFKNAFREAEGVINTINQLKTLKGYKWSDFAILYRTNAQSRMFEDTLKRAYLPYEIVGGVSFYDRKEIKDIISYLKVLINEDDDMAMNRILELQPGIGKVTITKARHSAEKAGLSIYKAVLQNNMFRTRKDDIADFIGRFSELKEMIDDPSEHWEIQEVIDQVCSKFYMNTLTKKDNIEERKENIEELKKLAIEYQSTADDPTMVSFLERIALYSDQDDLEEAGNTIKLMTGHSVKGLEFPVVFIVNAEEDSIPHKNCKGDPKQLEEERRIFFVMMTRAMERLYITYSANKKDYTGQEYQPILSRFVQEIPPLLKNKRAIW